MDRYMSNNQIQTMKDYGNKPLVINIDNAAKVNKNFRTALWTGDHLQVTLMSIPVGGDIEYADELTLGGAVVNRREM